MIIKDLPHGPLIFLLQIEIHLRPSLLNKRFHEQLWGVLFAGDELIETLPQQFALHNNYPNPFNPTTKISYSLSSASEVSLSIYNIRGELVNKLTSGLHEPGTHVVLWNGRNGLGEKVSTGVYIYSLSTPTGYLNKRLVLLK